MTRANGITHALSAPQAGSDGVILGQGSLIHLDGWTVEEMAIDTGLAMVVRWPAIQTRSFDFSTFSIRETPFGEAKEKAEKAQNELRDWLDAARHYAQAAAASSSRSERELKLEALGPGVRRLAGHRAGHHAKRDIEAALGLAEEYELRLVLGGGRDAWMLKQTARREGRPRDPESHPESAGSRRRSL